MIASLKSLADGLVRRYKKAEEQPPTAIYTDRDCCTQSGASKIKRLFAGWPEIHVRLDIWHFMRRLSKGVTTESHPLYGVFMAGISNCLFEWDSNDFQLLMEAKRRELVDSGVPILTDVAVRKAISREEAARHCRCGTNT